MDITQLPRVFEWKGRQLQDPNPKLDLKDVKGVLGLQYPDITNAEIKGPTETSEALVYTIKANYGQKG